MTPKWPGEFDTGLIATDNAMGIMTEELSPPAEAFVAMAAEAGRPVLDVGAAYGNATIPALAAGATVLANDLSATQLAVLAEATPVGDRPRLVLLPAKFPDGLPLAEASLDGILCSMVLHFFDGSAVLAAMAAMFRWLAPGRCVFITVMTPSNSYLAVARDQYFERERAGDPWPGMMDPRPLMPESWQGHVPAMVHVFEEPLLRRVVEGAGFEVMSAGYFCYRNFPEAMRVDGKEYLGLIARKPAGGN